MLCHLFSLLDTSKYNIKSVYCFIDINLTQPQILILQVKKPDNDLNKLDEINSEAI